MDGTITVAVLVLPPPMHGQAFVNRAVLDGVARSSGYLKVIDTSPGELRRGLTYHLKRMAKNACGALGIVRWRKHDKKVLYTVIESGYGALYNIVIVSLATCFGYKMVLHHHSALYAKKYSTRFAFLAMLAVRAWHIVLDDEMAADLKRLYKLRNVIVVNNACHVFGPAQIVDQRGRPLTCGFLSNLSLEKGLDTFIETMRRARAAGLELKILLAGPAIGRRAERLIAIAKMEFGANLEILGPISGNMKKHFFTSIDLFLFPSRYRFEAQPIVILEALGHGVPVITTPQGYSAQLVDDAGLCVSGEEYIAGASAFILRCASDQAFYSQLRQKAAQRYRFLHSKGCEQFEGMLDHLIGGAASL